MYAYEESDKNVINTCEMCNLISVSYTHLTLPTN